MCTSMIGDMYVFYSSHIMHGYVFVFFFFKQKTAYEMRISDWSSDVCSSDLQEGDGGAARSPAVRGWLRPCLSFRQWRLHRHAGPHRILQQDRMARRAEAAGDRRAQRPDIGGCGDRS